MYSILRFAEQFFNYEIDYKFILKIKNPKIHKISFKKEYQHHLKPNCVTFQKEGYITCTLIKKFSEKVIF